MKFDVSVTWLGKIQYFEFAFFVSVCTFLPLCDGLFMYSSLIHLSQETSVL
jgi:hypothetical protein